MPYMTPQEMKRREALVNQLRGTPMNDTGKKTDWGRGLAHMLRQYQAGTQGRALSEQNKVNTQLSVEDRNSFLEGLRTPDGAPAPDFSNMAITEGMDQGMVEGATEAAISTPAMNEREYSTPEGQNRAIAYLMQQQAAERASKAAAAKAEYDRETEMMKVSNKPRKLSFEDYNYLDSEGNNRTRSVAFDPYSGSVSPLNSGSFNPQSDVETTYSRSSTTPSNGSQGMASALRNLPVMQGGGAPTVETSQTDQAPSGLPTSSSDAYKDPKIAQDKVKTQKAKESMSTILGTLAQDFQSLYQMGGAVSNDQDFITNLKNGVLGLETINEIQERGLGPDVASGLRKSIFQTRPLLIGKIIQASDMSAKALDSNRELDFYLSALGDPGRNIQSQMSAILKLNEMMGTGEKFPWAEGVANTTRQLEKELEVQMEKQAADIAFTAQKYGLTEDEVRERLSEELVGSWNQKMQEEY